MRRWYLLLVIVLIASFVACKKQGETYNETNTATTATAAPETSATSTATSATSTSPPAALNDKDKDFVNSASLGGIAEVELAQDGVKHATNADVKSFAQKLVDDHTKANQELSSFASSRGVTTTAKVEGKMKETKERIMKLTGKSFDQAFVKQMIEDHTSTIKMFEDESKAGTDADLKNWVDKTLPTLRDHLKMAQDLQAKIGTK